MKLYIKQRVDMHSTCILDMYILSFGYIYYDVDIYIKIWIHIL